MANNQETKANGVTPYEMLKLIKKKAQETTQLITILTDYLCQEEKEAENVEATENAENKE